MLDFSFIFPSSRVKNERRELNNIFILKDKLIAIGYNPGEVDFMINSSSKGKKLSCLDPQQLQELESTLEAQLQLARQCIALVKEAN